MSITAKDLQDIFDGLGKAFGPGDVSHAAQAVGGRVIDGLHPATTNAREMTRLLGGGGRGSQRYNATGTAKTFAEQLGKSDTSGEPTGSRSKPFTVELSQGAATNLAKAINQAGISGGKPDSTLARFMAGFGATAAYSPLASIASKIKGLFNPDKPGDHPLTKPDGFTTIMDVARRNAEAVAKSGHSPGRWSGSELFGGGGVTDNPAMKLTREAMEARRKGKIVSGDAYGVAGEGGFSAGIKAPPAAGTAAAVETAGLDLAKLGGGALGVAAVFVEVGLEAAKVVSAALNDFAASTVEGNQHLSKWNGELAIANARLAIEDIKREAHMAGATGGTAAAAADAWNRTKDAWQPINEGLTNIKNALSVMAADVSTLLAFAVRWGTALGVIMDACNAIVGSKNNQQPIGALFDFLRSADHNARFNNIKNPQAVHGARAVRPGAAGGNGGMGGQAGGQAAAANRRFRQAMSPAGIAAARDDAPETPAARERRLAAMERHEPEADIQVPPGM